MGRANRAAVGIFKARWGGIEKFFIEKVMMCCSKTVVECEIYNLENKDACQGARYVEAIESKIWLATQTSLYYWWLTEKGCMASVYDTNCGRLRMLMLGTLFTEQLQPGT